MDRLKMFSVLLLAVSFPLALAGDCTAPDLPNGEVTSTGNANHNVATFSCQPGFTLVGRKIIKCMAGKWIGEFPMCIAIGICDPQDSPQIANGRKLKKFRGAVYKVKCDRGFKRYGPMYLTCEGSSWNFNNLPLCIKAGCDENEMSHLEYGQAKSMMMGAMYKFKCEEGTTMEGSSMVFCDGTHWNGTAPRCLYPTSPPTLGVAVEGTMTASPLSQGQTATVTCQSTGGHPAPLLTLYKNHQPVGSPQQYQATHTFTVESGDNGAVFQCEAKNEEMSEVEITEMELEVYWPTSPPSLELIVEGVTSSSPVMEGQTAMLLCQSKGGHPHPTLAITRNGHQVGEARQFRNTHTFTVDQEDNNAVFQCRAINQEMEDPVISEIVLNVHYGPTHVNLGGLDEAIAGKSSSYSCISTRSNPPSEIHWTVTDRNGHEITDTVEVFESSESWDGYGWLTESHLVLSPSSLPVMPSAILRCTATNLQTNKKVASKKWVTVQYAPEKVSVTGPSKIRDGDSLSLDCSSSPSVPESSLRWRVEQAGKGLEYPEPREDVSEMEDGSFVTRSILTMPVSSTQGSDIVAECYATNVVLGNDFRAYSHVVEVISPPSMPIISGMDSGVAVPFGSSQSLTCSAQAGSPPAKLHWYRGNQMMQAHYEVDGDTVKAQITFVPHHDDTELRCEAVNEALTKPISSSITIAVDARPETTTLNIVIESVSPTMVTDTPVDSTSEDQEKSDYDEDEYEYVYDYDTDEDEEFTEDNGIDAGEIDNMDKDENDDEDDEEYYDKDEDNEEVSDTVDDTIITKDNSDSGTTIGSPVTEEQFVQDSESPVNSEVIATSQSPVINTSQSPVINTSQSPVIATSQSPVKATSQSLVIATSQSPVIATSQSPVPTRDSGVKSKQVSSASSQQLTLLAAVAALLAARTLTFN